jgi:hypothetical protein
VLVQAQVPERVPEQATATERVPDSVPAQAQARGPGQAQG